MGYPFDSSLFADSSRCKNLSDLAHSDDAVFDDGFVTRLPIISAFDMDSFAKGAMRHYTGNAFPSCDAVIQDDNGRFLFIEFKNQRVGNVDDKQLLSKVFGSLLIANMTSAQMLPLRELMKRSVFIVVFPEQDYATMLGYALAHSAFPGRPILWGLDRLVAAEMLADAYTVTDREFVDMNICGVEKEARK